MSDPASDVDDATPIEAVKWCFVRRRVSALFAAHGYREVAPPPLELRGTSVLAHGRPAWPVGDDLELRADPLVSLAQLYGRSCRDHADGEPPMQRWLLSDIVFDTDASGPHRYPAWPAVSGAIFGVPETSAELELLGIAQRIASDLGLREASLRIGFPASDARADALRTGLAELGVRHVEADDLVRADGALAFEVSAQPDDGDARIAVMRGGRRDALLGALGEREAPLLGLSLSVRRAASCIPGGAESYDSAAEVFFCAVGERPRIAALVAAGRERSRGMRVEVELRELPLDAQMARGRALRARATVVFGEPVDEVMIRIRDEDLDRKVPLGELSGALRRLLR